MFDCRGAACRRLLRILLAVTFAALTMQLAPGVGLAHANLDRSSPENGATLSRAPTDVRLWFTEDVEPEFSRAVVTDGSGQPVSLSSLVAPDNPRLLIVALKPGLTSGWYAVFWQAQAKVDGHLTRGEITFGVGVSGPPPSVASAATVAQSGSGSALDVGLRWLILLSTIVIVGSFAFWMLQGRVLADRAGSSRRARIHPVQWALAEIAWIVFVIANLNFMINAVAEVSNVSALDDLGPPLVLFVTRTAYGQLWLGRMALAGILGIILIWRGNDCPSRSDGPALGIGAALLLTFSLASHSAAVQTLAPVAVANDWLHFAAVALWIGGLLQLAVVLTTSSRRIGWADRWKLLGGFTSVATYAVAMVAVTGLSEAWYHVGTPANLIGSPYGRVVLLKIALAVPLVALAARHHRRLNGGLSADSLDSKLPFVASVFGDRSNHRGLVWSICLEAACAVLVIAAVGLLTSLSPPT